jgi:hypothetical protein
VMMALFIGDLTIRQRAMQAAGKLSSQ